MSSQHETFMVILSLFWSRHQVLVTTGGIVIILLLTRIWQSPEYSEFNGAMTVGSTRREKSAKANSLGTPPMPPQKVNQNQVQWKLYLEVVANKAGGIAEPCSSLQWSWGLGKGVLLPYQLQIFSPLTAKIWLSDRSNLVIRYWLRLLRCFGASMRVSPQNLPQYVCYNI